MNFPRINLAETSDFDLGNLRVSPARRQVSMAGECRELEPKVAQVLIALAAASPAVVSRDRLVEQCWDGRIVGDDALNRCIVALRHLARDFSPQPFAIETVPRIGYSLVAGPCHDLSRHRDLSTTRKLLIGALVILLITAGAIFGWLRLTHAEAAPARIAVLPFRNLSAGNSYFAEGVSEEILDQLTSEPAFVVAGPESTAQFKGESDVRKIGRSLGVDYVLQGTVRPDGDRVRVNTSLTQTSDGMRLWSQSYERKLDDILDIQYAIGQAVAAELKRNFVHSATGSHQINGQAYALYLNARGLLRSGNPQSGEDAVALLHESIRLAPAFAPSWASLADALQLDGSTKGSEGLISILPQAQNAARHALQLDPNLAQAHGIFAELVGAETPLGIAHLRRAAALDPRTGEGQMWLGEAEMASGAFRKDLEANRRAHELDPLWPFPVRALVDNLAASGDRRAAEGAIRRGFPDDPMVQYFALGRVARLFGDYSEAVRLWSLVANGQSRWAAPARAGLNDCLFRLKLSQKAPAGSHLPLLGGNRFIAAVPMSTPPTAGEWQNRNRSAAAALVYADENVVAAKLMLLSGRARELVDTYDSPTGLLGIHPGEPIGALRVRDASIVALALRQMGRTTEASEVLRRSDAVIRTVYARGSAPMFFDDDAAGIWAVQGRPDLAIDALERSFRRGWLHVGHTDFAKLEQEPAFVSLRVLPRFRKLQAKYDEHFVRERQETVKVLNMRV